MPSDNPESPSSAFIERKLSTILSADVAEFSRLMSEDEEQTLRTFRGHKKIFEGLVATHRGRVFNTAGDAILAEFSSAVEAVRCATDIQSALRTRNDQLPPNRQVRFRIGVNIGDVLIQGQDLLGDGVNVAARLQTAAEPGGICISGSVHDQIRNKLSLTFHSLGEKTYKNIAQPIRTFSIAEMEDGAPLPSVKPPAVAMGRHFPKMAIAAVAMVLLLGAGYWAYTRNSPKTEQAPQNVPAALETAANVAPSEVPKAGSSSTTATANTAVAPATAANDKPAAAPGRAARAAAAPSEHSSAAGTPASAAAAPAAPPAGKMPAMASPYDGTYGGQICFDETKKEPLRCFHAEGVVTGHRITGRWPVGKNTGVTMFLEGDVNDAGAVRMELHSEKADGSRIITVDFNGAISDNRLDADGKFRMGRGANLHWHRIPHPGGA